MKKIQIEKREVIIWSFIIFFGISPVFAWALNSQIQTAFSNLNIAFVSFGQISGLIGVAFFSLSLILSARLKFIEHLFWGLNKVYDKHHKIGVYSLCLILLHPVFLGIGRYIPFGFPISTDTFKSFLLFFIPQENWTVNLGIAAINFFLTLMILTLFVKLKYNTWLKFHKFLGVVFVAGSVHGILSSSNMSENLVLKNYMLLIIFLGTISYVYKTVFGKFLIKRPKYIVKLVEEKTKDIYEITLSPLSQKIAFLPGQFAYFTVNQNFLSHESHPFSIASEPKENNLKILVKREGDYTSTLNKLQIGSRVNVEGPYGKFSYLLGKTKNQIWVAGGIGITPFLSMLPAILNKDYKIDLYYCVHDKNEFVYLSELSRIDQDFENFRFFPVITAQTGRLSSQKIKETSGNLLNKEIYICGPPEMIKSLTKQLLEEGINPAQIKSELFKMK